ncbi:p-loop containing nucleoside triphosphate hydrolase [Trichoderma arundinaceum]|uniref:p-loop containing nucleoside triphosphate hydrolase n=1 Tax=Trichoderma arundinaceum TaxID=490622 RepID=A0A395NRI3_TRIAR|nr:p-loop containing nucleoside triphosphate hydrolase [Trichoderma arundinaceum]
MDEFDSFLNPSGDQDGAFDDLGWSFISDTGAHPATNMLEGAGVDCELKRFDSVYDSIGDRVVLMVGSKTNITFDKERASSSALVLTKYWSRNKLLERKELEIKSPHMKLALKTVVPAYKDYQVHIRHIILRDEPQCLFHFHDELLRYGASLQDPTAAKHVLFLMKYMHWELSMQLSTYMHTMNVEKGAECLDYDCLWMAFRPGDLVYMPAKSHKDERIYEFISMNRDQYSLLSETNWSAKLLCIVSDGETFGQHVTSLRIQPFESVIPLRKLPIFPLEIHPEAAQIRERLPDRGKKFCSLYGSHYRQYNGVAELLSDDRDLTMVGEIDSFPLRSTMVNGRVMVDAKAFYEARPGEEADIESSRKSFDPERSEHLHMSDQEYLICTNKVAGYSLSDKKWGYFRVDLVHEVEFNEAAFGSLILDTQIKQQIQSLVQVYSHQDLQFDDVIRGKGRGMVFLLHGEPGVDVAALGTTAASVEEGLKNVFRFAERWKAVALLDEADVFLNRREITNLEQNSLVAVFLRVMEYYEGILFLTTNRISAIDQAFKSRIHLAIHYPKLSRISRQDLWHLFLSRSSAQSAEELKADGTLELIADEELNGRQIKNVVRLAHSLAFGEKTLIQPHHVTMALESMKDFEKSFGNGSEDATKQTEANELDTNEEHPAKRRRT